MKGKPTARWGRKATDLDRFVEIAELLMMPPVDFQFGRAGRRIAAFLSTITLLALAGCGGTGGYIENAPPRIPSSS